MEISLEKPIRVITTVKQLKIQADVKTENLTQLVAMLDEESTQPVDSIRVITSCIRQTNVAGFRWEETTISILQ